MRTLVSLVQAERFPASTNRPSSPSRREPERRLPRSPQRWPKQGQYLPFDPMLSAAGATIGGTVAAGISGPGRYRYGGIRDFLLGVQFISSDGAVINAGGKVVKNAAGFDIPKLLVGSLGRLGVMTELTFKVFPQPVAQRHCESHVRRTNRRSSGSPRPRRHVGKSTRSTMIPISDRTLLASCWA